MAWETRKGTGCYYTRSKRVNGRVVREYIGTGTVAQMIAMLDGQSRRERDEERAARNARRAEFGRATALVDRSWEAVLGLTRAVLVSNGYYRHHRGEWRKKRV